MSKVAEPEPVDAAVKAPPAIRNWIDDVGVAAVALTVAEVASVAAADVYEVVAAAKSGEIAPVETDNPDNVASVAALTTVVPVASTAITTDAAIKNFTRCFMVRFVSLEDVFISCTSNSCGPATLQVVQL